MKNFVLCTSYFVLCAVAHATAHAPYLTRVLDYAPAPGQFVNQIPACNPGDPYGKVLARAAEAICGTTETIEGELPDGTVVTETVITYCPGTISLGGYGGSVTVAFDHPVVNVPGEYDFEIYGNAIVADGSTTGGSAEPGIVLVSIDANGNGLPDDEWFELAGSEYDNESTQHDFTITYFKPSADHVAVPGSRPFDDTQYIRWESNDDNPKKRSGYVQKLEYHKQDYWPLWLDDDVQTLTFSGARLRGNVKPVNGMVELQFFDWGYVDNKPSRDQASEGDEVNPGIYSDGFDINWAVNSKGQQVYLPWVDFIKVYNAMNQTVASLGETSTEVRGGRDFHPDAPLDWLKGDLNGDHKIDVGDVNAVLDICLGNPGVTALADVNHDGTVDVGDVNALLETIINGGSQTP